MTKAVHQVRQKSHMLAVSCLGHASLFTSCLGEVGHVIEAVAEYYCSRPSASLSTAPAQPWGRGNSIVIVWCSQLHGLKV